MFGNKKASPSALKTWLGSGSLNLFGIPYSGKDTQAKLLSELLGGPVIGGGDIIRHSNNEYLKNIVSDGSLAPQADYIQLVTPFLSREEFTGKPLILNSVGRWFGEHEQIMGSCKKSGHPLSAVIYINISEPTLMQRWNKARELGDRGERSDDEGFKIGKRIEEFNAKTMPVIEFYRTQDMLIEINGEGTREKVFETIQIELSKKFSI